MVGSLLPATPLRGVAGVACEAGGSEAGPSPCKGGPPRSLVATRHGPGPHTTARAPTPSPPGCWDEAPVLPACPSRLLSLFLVGTFTGTKSGITENGASARAGSPSALAAMLVTGLVVVAVAVVLAHRSRRLPCRRYAGTRRAQVHGRRASGGSERSRCSQDI